MSKEIEIVLPDGSKQKVTKIYHLIRDKKSADGRSSRW